MGRKTLLLDDNVRNTILDLIGKGNYIKTACMAAGVSEHVYYDWVNRAEHPDGNGNEVYVQFLQELKKARQQNITQRVAKIQEAGEKPQNWPANAWLLERMEPGEYGRRMELEVGPSRVLLALQENARKALTAPILVDTTLKPAEGAVNAISEDLIEETDV